MRHRRHRLPQHPPPRPISRPLFTFAHWTRVLAGLGRVEMVRLLYAEDVDREFTPGPIETMVARTGEALALVISQPGGRPPDRGQSLGQ
jgi:hypothetical protein